MDGILVIDKPPGMTSADVVAEVKRRLRAARVGHTGTLDPMATGVLPIALGEGTKLAPFLLADDKGYEGELELGVTTDTLDAEGTVTGRADAAGVTAAELRAAMAAWLGPCEQIPPMFSALKQGGKRLYELARQGLEVDRAPRPIRIGRFELLGFDPPRARFAVDCSKGTYVRSLVRDVGQAVGCGATLTALRRTRAGRFVLTDAVPLERLDAAKPVDPAVAVDDLPTLQLDQAGVARVLHGKAWDAPDGFAPGGRLRMLTPSGALAAIAEIRQGRFHTLRVFNYGLTRPQR